MAKNTNNGRVNYSPEQLDLLEDVFSENQNPTPKDYRKLESLLETPIRKLQIWFQNRRAKERKMLRKAVGQPQDPLEKMRRDLYRNKINLPVKPVMTSALFPVPGIPNSFLEMPQQSQPSTSNVPMEIVPFVQSEHHNKNNNNKVVLTLNLELSSPKFSEDPRIFDFNKGGLDREVTFYSDPPQTITNYSGISKKSESEETRRPSIVVVTTEQEFLNCVASSSSSTQNGGGVTRVSWSSLVPEEDAAMFAQMFNLESPKLRGKISSARASRDFRLVSVDVDNCPEFVKSVGSLSSISSPSWREMKRIHSTSSITDMHLVDEVFSPILKVPNFNTF